MRFASTKRTHKITPYFRQQHTTPGAFKSTDLSPPNKERLQDFS